MSSGDFDDVNEDMVFLELRSAVEIFDGNFSWNLETKELALKNISVKIPMGGLCSTHQCKRLKNKIVL